MKPHKLIAGIAAAALYAAPLANSASAATLVSGHLSNAQVLALRAKNLPFIGYAQPNQPVRLMIHLPLRNSAEATALTREISTPSSPIYHHFLTSAQFAARYAPSQSDMLATASALRAAGFTVTKIESQFIHVTGTARTVNNYFGTTLGLVRDGRYVHVDARTHGTMPLALTRVGATVIGLSARPLLHPDHLALGEQAMRMRAAAQKNDPMGILKNPASFFSGAYGPAELLQAYGEPSYTFARGVGEHIGIVGYSDSADADNHKGWCYYGLGPSACGTQATTGGPSVPYPTLNHFDWVGYIPPNTDGNSFEATLDAQMAGGSAAGAVIDQYASDAVSNFGFLDAYSYIAYSNVDDVITTSYSECEDDYIPSSGDPNQVPFYLLQAYNDTFVQGTAQGQTFNFSSGDNGAYGCAYEGNTANPSASALAGNPNVTGVGGTTELTTSGTTVTTTYVSESSNSDSGDVWGSGGGVSQLFATPSFQNAIGLPSLTTNGTYGLPYGTGRQVPDISMHMGGPASPFTADVIYYGGDPTGNDGGPGLEGVIGTSASCPEFAAWIADGVTSINAIDGHPGTGFRVGNINNILYYEQATGQASHAFHQNIPGDNLVTHYNPGSGMGYNQVIGLGTPNWPGLYTTVLGLPGYQAAGNTFTTSNP